MTELLRLDWLTDADVFVARQRGRDVAAAMGFDQQDQVRVATALSEIGRELFGAEPSAATFVMVEQPLRLRIEISVPSRDDVDTVVTRTPARRLLDSLEVTAHGDRVVVALEKTLHRSHADPPPSAQRVREAVEILYARQSPLDELRVQNADLIDTLVELRRRQNELARLNEELATTNQGVMAMYGQLSAELDETNRGVVALYAELDEKGHQLAQANEAKTRFLRNVSHELRSPINSILGLADLLTGSQLDPEQRRQVDYLHSSGQSLLKLVNELLDLARAESDRLEADNAPVDLAALLADLRGTLRPVAATRRIDLVIEEPEIEVVVTDAELLARVLRNLLSNALSFTEHGEVRVRTTRRESGQHVEFAVSDTGIGIAPEDVDRIFEEFVQVPNHLQAARAGTGLGLPYARRLVQTLGGTLDLVSTPGKGSTFTVVLPLDVSVASDGPVPDLRVEHVLVVDDDAAFRHVVRSMLQGIAERVSEAGDGAEALAALEAAPATVVLLDLRMPTLGGAETLSALRSHVDPALRAIPTILLTSVDIDAAVRRAAEPAAALLSKSDLNRTSLLRAIATVLGGTEDRP